MIISLFLLMVLVVLLSSFVVYRMAFYSRGKRKNLLKGEQYARFDAETKALMEELDGRSYEEVTTESDDHLSLYGRYYRGRPDAPTAICFHGYKGSMKRDFSGGSKLLSSLGYNVLLVSQRGHGRSGGSTIAFGINEKLDLLKWVDYVEKRGEGNGEIFLFGISMGGATVLMASGLELPPSVKGIIADCPYSSPSDIIEKTIRDMKLPGKLSMPLVYLAARLCGSFSLKCETAAEAVKKTRVPILIIHGLDDRFVPDYMSREVWEANPAMVRRETFPGAGHGLSYMVDRERYWRIVESFLRDNA